MANHTCYSLAPCLHHRVCHPEVWGVRCEGLWGRYSSFIQNPARLLPAPVGASNLCFQVFSGNDALNVPSSASQSHLSVQLSRDVHLHIHCMPHQVYVQQDLYAIPQIGPPHACRSVATFSSIVQTVVTGWVREEILIVSCILKFTKHFKPTSHWKFTTTLEADTARLMSATCAHVTGEDTGWVAGPSLPIYLAAVQVTWSPASYCGSKQVWMFPFCFGNEEGKTFTGHSTWPVCVSDTCSSTAINTHPHSRATSSRPATKCTHMHLLHVTPFALLIPVCLEALEE